MALAIDPDFGKRGKGNACSEFNAYDYELVQTFFQRPNVPIAKFHPICDENAGVIVIEKPQFTGQSEGKDPNNILELAWQGMHVAATYRGMYWAELVEYTPTQWKGGQHKPHMHWALWDVLSKRERALIGGERTLELVKAACACLARKHANWRKFGYLKTTLADTLDSVALGCVHLGRLPKP